jgi:hypothetical protein
MLLAPAWR